MTNRTVAATFLAICCVGLGLAPIEAAAGPGGVGGRGVAIGAPRVGALPLVRPGQVPLLKPQGPAVNPAIAGGLRRFHRGFARGHGRFFRGGVPALAGIDAPGGIYPYGEPGAGSAVLWPGPQTAVRPTPPGDPVVVNGRICFAQAYLVPSEAGGTRSVKVTRC